MDATLATLRNFSLDADGRINVNVRCLVCGYNLRSLFPDGRCPECGTAVGRSTHGDLLQFCEPTWVEALASGMNWIVAGLCLGILVGILGALVSVLLGKPVVARLMGTVSGLVGLVGYWKVTTPDPSRFNQDQGIDTRKLARFGLIAGYVLNLPQFAIISSHPTASQVVSIVASIFGLVGTIAIFVYAARLARRIPDFHLARHTRIVMWGFIGASVGGLLMTVLVLGAGAGTGAPAGLTIAGIVGAGCVIALGFLVFSIWAIVLLVRYRRAFRQAARRARATWAGSALPLDSSSEAERPAAW